MDIERGPMREGERARERSRERERERRGGRYIDIGVLEETEDLEENIAKSREEEVDLNIHEEDEEDIKESVGDFSVITKAEKPPETLKVVMKIIRLKGEYDIFPVFERLSAKKAPLLMNIWESVRPYVKGFFEWEDLPKDSWGFVAKELVGELDRTQFSRISQHYGVEYPDGTVEPLKVFTAPGGRLSKKLKLHKEFRIWLGKNKGDFLNICIEGGEDRVKRFVAEQMGELDRNERHVESFLKFLKGLCRMVRRGEGECGSQY